ncbi:hypothetical protein GQ53DRAFT_748281 [Thozetella sp. PMI_491]|nr:hypothetical protein GQ53DRAFT_748281 [Thozetella sp. PMI_491]
MVALPLFKLASLFVRHVSKYGANRIKIQAHEHPRFRQFAAKYGQIIHQINMRTSVALLRNVDAELKAKEKAETPTVKTKEQVEKEEQKKAKQQAAGTTAAKDGPVLQSIWRRHFRPLPEAKAVDLFADVAGDAFVLIVATALILFEYYRSSVKPDKNAERIKELSEELEKVKEENSERKETERKLTETIIVIEDALRAFKDPKTKQPLLLGPTPLDKSTATEKPAL